jgi:hypothetical protein
MNRRRSWLFGVIFACLAALVLTWLINLSNLKGGYCWLVFGPRGETRLLLHKSGEEWFLDRDGDGAFRGNEERLGFSGRTRVPLTITNLAGQGVAYTLTSMRDYHDESLGDRCLVEVEVEASGRPTFAQLADIDLGRTRRRAGFGHFNGPLTVQIQTAAWQLPPGLALRRGDKPTDIRVLIGTVDGATRCWTTVLVMGTNSSSRFPTNTYPVVDVEFPVRDSRSAPLHVRYPLKEFC